MVPTLALGIPGSATTAVILTGLIIHGVRPGPDLFKEQPEFLYGIFGAMLVANVLFLFLVSLVQNFLQELLLYQTKFYGQ